MSWGKLLSIVWINLMAIFQPLRAQDESIDLKTIAKYAQKSIMLVVVYDSKGNQIGTGTGFTVFHQGELLTNHHVIEKASKAVAKNSDGELIEIEGVLADDPINDLCILRMKKVGTPFLEFSKKPRPELGTRLAVIGNPLGLEGTISEGIVSGWRMNSKKHYVMQITAPISPGSSGSPVLNRNGEVIGIASSGIIKGQSLNFAIPSEYAEALHKEKTIASMPLPLVGFSDKIIINKHQILSIAENFMSINNTKIPFPPRASSFHRILGKYNRIFDHGGYVCEFTWDDIGIAVATDAKSKEDISHIQILFNLNKLYDIKSTFKGNLNINGININQYSSVSDILKLGYKQWPDLPVNYELVTQTYRSVILIENDTIIHCDLWFRDEVNPDI